MAGVNPDEVIQQFTMLLAEINNSEMFQSVVEIVSNSDWDEVPGLFVRFVQTTVQYCKNVPASNRVPYLNLLHEMANASPEMCEAVAPVLPDLVIEAARGGGSKVWDAVTEWKASTALPLQVFATLKTAQERSEASNVNSSSPPPPQSRQNTAATLQDDSGTAEPEHSLPPATPLTVQALEGLGGDSETLTIEEEMRKRDQDSIDKVLRWLSSGGTMLQAHGGDEGMLAPVKALPPVEWGVDPAAVGPFIDKVSRGITEILVDTPSLRGPLGEMLAHTTSVVGQVEKARRLQELARLVSSLSGGTMTKAQFVAGLEQLMPRDLPKVPVVPTTTKDDIGSAESAGSRTDEDEYDPMALDDDEAITADTMVPQNFLYLPQGLGRDSVRLIQPALGPSHVLCRLWGQRHEDWVGWSNPDTRRVHSIRVVFVRRER